MGLTILTIQKYSSSLMHILLLILQMGGSDSKQKDQQGQKVQISPDPLIQRLRRTMKLTMNETTHATFSFMNQIFVKQITKNKDGRMSLDYSPFCSIVLPDKKERILGLATCTIISPIMAMVPIMRIANQTGFIFSTNLILCGVAGGKDKTRRVKKIILVKEGNLALLVLQEPIWELGWCGITYMEEEDDIGNMPFHSIFNIFAESQKPVIQESEEAPIMSQRLQKIYCKQSQRFEGRSSKLGENFLLKFIDRKPYLVGVHRQQKCLFFTKQLIKTLQSKTSEYLTPNMQKQFLKQIDIQQMQMQSTW